MSDPRPWSPAHRQTDELIAVSNQLMVVSDQLAAASRAARENAKASRRRAIERVIRSRHLIDQSRARRGQHTTTDFHGPPG